MRKDSNTPGRRLTHDELKAAEDAFQGRPFNEARSQAALTVYEGILFAKMKLDHERFTRGRAPQHDAAELVGAGSCWAIKRGGV
jgi:hypothetical protein